MFQTSEPTHVKHYEYGHDLGIGNTNRFVSMLFSIVNRMFLTVSLKNAEVVCHIENFNNFVVG